MQLKETFEETLIQRHVPSILLLSISSPSPVNVTEKKLHGKIN